MPGGVPYSPYYSARPVQASQNRLGTTFLIIFLFLEMSRLVETLTGFVRVDLHLAIILMSICLLAAVFTGGLMDSLRTPVVVMFILFTCWLMLATLTSQWRGGSVATLTIWVMSFGFALVTPALITSLDQCRRVFYAFAFALWPILAATLLFSSKGEGRDETTFGTLSNPNDLALHLLVLIPFAGFVMSRESWSNWKKLVCVPAVLFALIKIFRTGSRAGVLSIVVCLLILFLLGKVATKMKMVGAAGLLVAIFLASVPDNILLRYSTILSGTSYEDSMSITERSAVESTRARKMLFEESFRLTMEHPLFGVGPGIFSAALAGDQAKRGENQSWHEAHNSFTQISSEAGIPAFLLYTGILLYSLKRSASIYFSARKDPNRKLIAEMSGTLATALLIFGIGATFGTYSYTIHLPILAGIVQAFDVCMRRELKNPQPAAPSPQLPQAARLSTPIAVPKSPPRVPNYVRHRRLRDRRV